MITFLFARPTCPFSQRSSGEPPAKKSRVEWSDDDSDHDSSVDIKEASPRAVYRMTQK